MLLDVLLALGLLLSTASQLRLPGVPIGPGEICLAAWLALTLFREVARLGPPLTLAFSQLLLFWLVFAFALSVGTAVLLAYFWPSLNFNHSIRILTVILAPGFLVFLLGLYDDIRTVGPYTKFLVQALAATMLYFGGLRISDLPLLLGQRRLPEILIAYLSVNWMPWQGQQDLSLLTAGMGY